MQKLILSLISISLLISCNNSPVEETQNNKDTISNIQQIDTVKNETTTKPEINIIEKYKYLGDIFNKNDSLYSKFIEYLTLLNSDISDEKQIIEVFDLRKNLLNYASSKVDKFYYGKGENDSELWNNAEKELISIGFLPIYTEGMYVTLDKSDILNEEIEKYASKPFKLKIKFDVEYAKSSGGEYPYAGLDSYLTAFEPAYELYKNYKSSKYYKEIENTFKELLVSFVDIHKVKNECFEGGLHFSLYPWETICNMPELFEQKFPNNVFTPVFNKLKTNMSELDPKSENYLLVTDQIKGDNYRDAINKIFDYMEKGIDVVHFVKLKNKNDEQMTYIVYRFYSDKSNAEQQLETIKKLVPDTKIVTVKFDDKENLYEL